jgi:hypothetical protein
MGDKQSGRHRSITSRRKMGVWTAVRIVALVRRELRLDDNPLWQHADGHNEVIPLFVSDDFNQQEHGDNLRSLFFFALKSLRERIAEHGGRLVLHPLLSARSLFCDGQARLGALLRRPRTAFAGAGRATLSVA